MGGRRRPGAFAGLALAVLVACGAGESSTGVAGDQPSTSGTAPAATTTTAPTGSVNGDEALRRRDVPPDGVPAQLTFLAATDGCVDPHDSPAVEAANDSYSLGDFALICVYAFDLSAPVMVQVTPPGGREVRQRDVSTQGDENAWSFELGPGDPTGDYTIAAVQGATRATGRFTAVLPFSPFIGTLDPRSAPAGTTFRFGFVSSELGQELDVRLYHRENFVFRYATTLGSVTTDQAARASYELSTATGTPTGTYCLVASSSPSGAPSSRSLEGALPMPAAMGHGAGASAWRDAS